MNHTSLTLYIIVFTLIPFVTQGQQLPIFNQYTEMQNYLNPAATSIDYLEYNQQHSLGLTYRMQWVGLEGAPRTGLLRYEYVGEKQNLATVGGMLITDRIGPSTLTGVYGKYSYQIRPSYNGNLLIGVGLSAGLVQYHLDGNQLEFEADDQLAGETANEILPDFGFGVNVTYYPEQGVKFYAGLSVPQIAGLNAGFETLAGAPISIKRLAHYYATGGAIFPIGQQGFLEPSFWIKHAPNTPVNLDFNLRQKFVNNFWMGLGYGTSKSIHLEMGVILSQKLGLKESIFRIGYGFDYNIATYGNLLGVSHELTLSYAWSK